MCSVSETKERLLYAGNEDGSFFGRPGSTRMKIMYVREVLTARERHLFAASSRKVYECLSDTPAIDRFVCAMEFGISLLSREESKNNAKS